jgi:hypothetical protein
MEYLDGSNWLGIGEPISTPYFTRTTRSPVKDPELQIVVKSNPKYIGCGSLLSIRLFQTPISVTNPRLFRLQLPD